MNVKKTFSRALFIDLYLNNVGNLVAATHTEGINTISANDYDTAFSLQSTILLNKNDKIWLQIRYMSPGVYLSNHFTYFTGWLIQEDLSKLVLWPNESGMVKSTYAPRNLSSCDQTIVVKILDNYWIFIVVLDIYNIK